MQIEYTPSPNFRFKMNKIFNLHVPLAKPPWTGLGKRLESLCRKALYEFQLIDGVEHLGIALSGGKDSLSLLYLLKAISGRGFPPFKITAIHVDGAFSCGSGVSAGFLKQICKELGVEYVSCQSTQTLEKLECYTCSRERRSLIFKAAKSRGIDTIAFGHHRDDSIQTLLMNLLHKAEFAAMLPKVPMHDYGITLIRPLIFVTEEEIKEFAAMYKFTRITCQCPIGQNSMRKTTKSLIDELEKVFPNAKENLAQSSLLYGSTKALHRKRPEASKI